MHENIKTCQQTRYSKCMTFLMQMITYDLSSAVQLRNLVLALLGVIYCYIMCPWRFLSPR